MDGINVLPDELLVMILSCLKLKEAAASSILSRRWRYLWTFTGRLDFDGMDTLLKLRAQHCNSAILAKERSKYVKWVNHVIASRNDSAPVIDFKVVFYFNKSHEEQIHEWIRYALERKVQTLELGLSRLEGILPPMFEQFCSFPYKILQEQQQGIHFKQLRRISLQYVEVSGEALEFLLRNCPLLEGLSVYQSRELVTLRVIGPIPSLKLLEIWSCQKLESVEIRDVNLVRFIYSGTTVKFFVENAPVLVDLYLGAGVRCLEHFSNIVLRQLELLDIEIHSPEECLRLSHHQFWNLKRLVVKYYPDCVESLLPLANIVSAAPCLEIFVVEALVRRCCCKRKIEEKEKKNLYGKLKEVSFVLYHGVVCQLELLMHLVENAPLIQKITIFTYSSNIPSIRQQLAARVPRSIILQILSY